MLVGCPAAFCATPATSPCSLMLLAWLSAPPSVPRSRTVNCCSTATATAAAGGVLDGSAGWVESSQAARLARSQTPHTVRFMKDLRAESGWVVLELVSRGHTRAWTRRDGVAPASCPGSLCDAHTSAAWRVSTEARPLPGRGRTCRVAQVMGSSRLATRAPTPAQEIGALTANSPRRHGKTRKRPRRTA